MHDTYYESMNKSFINTQGGEVAMATIIQLRAWRILITISSIYCYDQILGGTYGPKLWSLLNTKLRTCLGLIWLVSSKTFNTKSV